MLKFLVVLKSGGDFIPENAYSLARQVHRHLHIAHEFVCLTDMEVDHPLITPVPLRHGWPGWWSVMEMFRVPGPVIATGLDTILVDSIDRLGEIALTCPEKVFYMTRPQPRARARGEKFCSGIMIWNGDWSLIYDAFAISPRQYIRQFRLEQRFTTHALLNCKDVSIRVIQDEFSGFYSYKNDCMGKGKPEDARFIAFHGFPRPHQCRDQWVKDIYFDEFIPVHPMEILYNVYATR